MKNIILLPVVLMSITLMAQESKEDSLRLIELKEVRIIAQNIKSIPGSGQYIASNTLTKLDQTDINNVLRTVPGVNIRDEDGYGLRPNIGLRGTPVNRSAKITLMEDGILIAPAPYSDPAAYYFPTFARMHGVEVLKGSSQIKYGPYTIGGAINLLSTPIPKSFKGYAQFAYGSFNTNQERLYLGDSRKNLDYLFEINRLASSGFKELNHMNTGFERQDILGKIRWHSDENAKVTQALTLKLVNSFEEGNETYLGLTYDDYVQNPRRRYAGTQKDRLDMLRNDLSLNYSCMPVRGLSFNTSIYNTSTFRDWARASKFGGHSINSILSDPVLQDTAFDIMKGLSDGDIDFKSAARHYFARGIQSNASYYFQTGDIKQRIELGIRYHADQSNRYATISKYFMQNGIMTLTNAGIDGNDQNQQRNAQTWASFLSYEINYKGLRIYPGIRYEKIYFDLKDYGKEDYERLGSDLESASNSLNVFLPGIGFNYKKKSMNIFGGVHKGFSPPGMPSLNTHDEQADIESSINYELGYRHESNKLKTQLTLFLNDYKNILGSDNASSGGIGTGNVFNAGQAKIQGLEFSLNYDLLYSQGSSSKYKLPVSLAYTFTQAIFQDTFTSIGGDYGKGIIYKDDRMPFITPNLLSASIGFEYQNFDLTLLGRYVGETRVTPGQDIIVTPSTNVPPSQVNGLKSYFILDVSSNFKLNQNVIFYALINNITNSKAIIANVPQGYRPNMPLSLNLGIKLNF